MTLLYQDNFDSYTNGQSLNGLSGGSGWSGNWVGGGETITNLFFSSTPNSLLVNINGSGIQRPFANLSGATVAFSVAVRQTTGNINNFVSGLKTAGNSPQLMVYVAGSTGVFGSLPYEIIIRFNNTTILTGVQTNDVWAIVDIEADTTTGQFRGRVNSGAWTAYSTDVAAIGSVFNGFYSSINGSNGPSYIDSIDVYDNLFPVVVAPTVTTSAATSILDTTTTLNGIVNPNGTITSYYFEYGTTIAYGSTTTATSAGSGSSNVSVSTNLTGLTASTLYHYRLVATNAGGTTNGADMTLTTIATPAVLTATCSVNIENAVPGAKVVYTAVPVGGYTNKTYLWSDGKTSQTEMLEIAEVGTTNNQVTVSDGITTVVAVCPVVTSTLPNKVPLVEVASKKDWDRLRVFPTNY
jgi:hypothetical protein